MKYIGLICLLGMAPMAAHAWPCASASNPSGWINTTPGGECYMTPQQIASLEGIGSNNTNTLGQGQTANGGNAQQGQSQSNGQSQGQSANSNQSQSVTSSGNSKSTGGSNVGDQQTDDSVSNYSVPREPVATAYAPVMVPTMPCFKTYGAGVQTVPVGISFGGGKVDKECERQIHENGLRANAQALAELGERRLAVMTICAIPSEREALGAACVYEEYHLAPAAPMPLPCTITSPSPCELPAVPAAEERIERQKAHGFPGVNK